MLAQVVLMPAELKKLISKAIVKLDVVRHAASEGMLLRPSKQPIENYGATKA